MIGPAYLQVYKLTSGPLLLAMEWCQGTVGPWRCWRPLWSCPQLLTFGPQRRNAQIQYNAVRHCAPWLCLFDARAAHEHVAIQPMSQISGPGFGFHVWRNAMAMMGIRLFSPHTEKAPELKGAFRAPRGSETPPESRRAPRDASHLGRFQRLYGLLDVARDLGNQARTWRNVPKNAIVS